MKIITKEKGDTGLIQVIANLDSHGIKVALPISEHLPFDLIAISDNLKLSRVSVKYVSIVHGSIAVPLRSISTNMKGWKAKTINYNDIDSIAVYCPNNKKCYYINKNKLIHLKACFFLREDESVITKTTNKASDYEFPSVIFD